MLNNWGKKKESRTFSDKIFPATDYKDGTVAHQFERDVPVAQNKDF